MREVITKVLQCAAVLAFCFNAEGMRDKTFICEEGRCPKQLDIIFNSASDITSALQRGIEINYKYYKGGKWKSQRIYTSRYNIDNGYVIFNNGNQVDGFRHFDTKQPIKLSYKFYDAEESGTYIVKCCNYAEIILWTKAKKQYWWE